jgi:hypothetical protein
VVGSLQELNLRTNMPVRLQGDKVIGGNLLQSLRSLDERKLAVNPPSGPVTPQNVLCRIVTTGEHVQVAIWQPEVQVLMVSVL